MFAVGVAHLVFGVHFCGTLVFAYLYHLHLDAKLGKQVFDKHRLCSDAMPVQTALGIEIYFVGNRCQIICTLCIGFAISNNPLAAFAEIGQSLSKFLERGKVGAEQAGFQINAFDIFVVFGFLNGG